MGFPLIVRASFFVSRRLWVLTRGVLTFQVAVQEAGEGLTETLVREILEETGFTVLTYSNPRIYDAMVRIENSDFFVYHIMALYDFKINEAIPQQSLPPLVEDGLNDSQAIKWLSFDQITPDNSSPLVLKIKDEYLGNPVLDKSVYDGWEVK